MIETHVATAFLLTFLAVVAWVDWRTMRIPDWLNAIAAIAGLVANWALGRSLVDAVIGAAAGYLLMASAAWAYRMWRGRDGLGLGDAKLLAAAGAWLGWMALPFVVLGASALGLAFVAAARIAGQRFEAGDALPFGPFLCAATFGAWLIVAYV